jgi:amino acid adenylation domain-containing protein
VKATDLAPNAAEAIATFALPGAGRRSVPDPYAETNLTSNQLQVWIGQNLLPEVPIYNLAVALQLAGAIDPSHFREAFRVLVRSSDALRTVVEEADGLPTQRVLEDAPAGIEFCDLSDQPDALTRARTSIAERCQRPLDWRRALYDSALVKTAADRFVWYLNVHHIVCDGWSFELIYRHMSELYRQSLESRLPTRLSLPTFDAYIAHERLYRQSSRHQKAQAYWSEVLANGGDIIRFYGRTPFAATTRVRRISKTLGTERTAKLKSIAATIAGGTESSAIFDAFAAVLIAYLHCLNGSDTYTIGVPFHNRRSQAAKQTIGFFSEVLPVRVILAEDETLASLSRKFSAEVRRTLRYGQHSVTNPIFKRLYEVTLNYHTTSFSDFGGIAAVPEWIHNGHGDESLGIQIRDFNLAHDLVVDFDLHEGLFNEDESARVVMHFFRVLDAFLLDANRPLRSIGLASPEETQRLLAAWKTPIAPAQEQRYVHRLVEKQAKQHPDAIAVKYGKEQLSYDDLNHLANTLARLLQSRGVTGQTPVGIYLNRSPQMIVALLGTLKAGGAYVPIDPQYSREWLKYIIDDTDAPILLTERGLLGTLPELNIDVICLEEIAETLAQQGEDLDAIVAGDDLAYIIYTSGSSGAPKGVQICHRALTNFACEAASIFEIKSSDRVLQFASLSFDTSVEEIFPCLTHGATLVLRNDAMLDSIPAFLEECRDSEITVLDLPTAYWHQLTAALFADRCALPNSLRLVIIGGERAIPERLALWQASFAGGTVRLVNTYGPTETTVASTTCDLTDAPVEFGVGAEVPIGRPIGNVRVLVLDQNLNPVPEGVPGELYIGGIGLARGYLNKPELTAEKFLRDPFNEDPESRLFRTGDLVRSGANGNLEFLGRVDRQVKIRGFRVELDGIEAVLRKHPLIQDAAVIYDSMVHKCAVGYLVPKEGAVLNTAEVKNFVAAKLPEYMVPAALITIDALPVTRSGKIDRRALPPLENTQCENDQNPSPPQSELEESIAQIWRELLSRTSIGRDQHFFALGGDSLSAAQAVSRIRRKWQVEIPLRVIFEAPTIALLAERVEQALQHIERDITIAETTPVWVHSYNGRGPASDSQSRIWYMDQFAPDSSAYNIAAAVRIAGRLERQALELSLNQLVQRHESLRTTVLDSGGQPLQVIAPVLQLELPEIDLSALPEDLRIDEARRILRENGRRPFDLCRGPLLRALLVRLNDEDHVLFLAMHHIISDQWSLGVIAREISILYNGFRNGVMPSLDPLPAQYGDFAVWQGRWLSPERLAEETSYWKKQLVGMQPAAIPTDYSRPRVQTFKGDYASFGMPKRLVETLRRLAHAENASLYMVCLALFKILLSRYSGQSDVAIGSPIANRTLSEWESVIGTFINILVLRTDLSGNPSVRQVIRRVREIVLEGFTHQQMPFQRLVEELVPGRDASRSPLVQVLFNFQSTPVGNIQFEGISWAPFEIDQWAAQFDVSVTIDPEITQKIFVSYNTDLYKPATIGRMLRHYVQLMEAAAVDPDQSLAALSRLVAEQEGQRAVEGDERGLSVSDACLHELIESQAQKTPTALAAIYEDQQLTYRDLNERASELARRLRAFGVGPEKRVGIALERSAELVIGILAVLKAGAAYVPLDPAYPHERIAFIIRDSSMTVLLSQQAVAPNLPQGNVPILCLDALDEPIGEDATQNSPRRTVPEQLAYVLYTSGSTGMPKGVEISHRSLVNFLQSMKKRPGLDATDVLLSVTTISFDIAALELFLPLINGARVVIANRGVVSDGKRLIEQLDSCGATVMQATPTTWRLMLEAGWRSRNDFKILCGGEALPLNLAQGLVAQSVSVWNLYGPTETTIWSSLSMLERPCENVSIGRPIHNTEIYVLDSDCLLLPTGVTGELYIGGEGVARGYLNRPDLTAEKFIPNPFGPSSSRLYRTGDLGRCLTDGNIEFIGRLDNQVKIRGYRIELGEVEAVLSGHSSVKQAVVVAREEATGASAVEADKRLVAYVILEEGHTLSENELIGYAKEKLPNYMVPSAFMFLESLPLTPNGKIDWRALPAPDSIPPQTVESIAARTPIEEIIHGVWQQILKRSRVGIYQNFFELGGHSLLATQMIARLREAFQMEVALRAVFDGPTIAELASFIAGELGVKARPPLKPIPRLPDDDAAELSFAQERLWFLTELQRNHSAYNISLAVRITGALDVGALKQSLGVIIGRHDALRTTFPTIDGRAVQLVGANLAGSVSVVDLLDIPPAEREQQAIKLGMEFVRRPFDLTRGPLFRIALFRLADAEHVLVFAVHHIVFDARSSEIFLGELVDFYKAALTGTLPKIDKPPIQYRDYAAWQRTLLQGETVERLVKFWLEHLDGSPQLLRLPTDRRRPSTKTHRGACHSWILSTEIVEGVRRLSRNENATPFMTLLAAFNVLLYRYSGQDDIIIGTPVSNRHAAETEEMIGLFVNTLALRTRLSGDPSFLQLLSRVRETALSAYAHQDLPLEQLLHHLRLERDLAYTPLFQVMFQYETKPAQDLAIPGLLIRRVEVENGSSKFDLTLSMIDSGDEVRAVFEYDTDLFDSDRIERMAGHLHTLLQSIVADPDRSISEFALLNESERAEIFENCNGAEFKKTEERFVHRLFEAQAERTPEAAAIVSEGESWTYRDLNSRANQIARILQKHGVGPETLVGICMERAPELMIALLAILKTGGTYVPLDPDLPQSRLDFMLRDAGCAVVLTQSQQLERMPREALEVICLDPALEIGVGEATENLDVQIHADNAVYVIYTSGSTGTPKGVVVRHRSLVNYLTWAVKAYSVEQGEGAAVFSSISFDLTVTSLFSPLLVGRAIELVRDNTSWERLGIALSRRRFSFIKMTPTHVTLIARQACQSNGGSGSIFIIGGENLTADHVGFLRGLVPHAKVINEYGPSEATVGSCMYRVPDGMPESASIPIGKPIADTQVYLLDSRLEVVPIAVVGELYIGGEGVARGYLNRPDLTAEKFIPNPFGPASSRLYRTGDLGRYLTDGNIEFIGRLDNQVKIRGYRIELGEVEAVLSGHSSVKQAVVVAREEATGASAVEANKRLVAYVILEEGHTLSENELIGYAKEKLPNYMVPSAFMFLESLPLTPNGKIDRKTLPAPGRISSTADRGSPADRLEFELLHLWRNLLRVDGIGLHDDFFDLGGDSLLALRLIAAIEKHFAKKLQLNDFFAAPTVAAVAALLRVYGCLSKWSSLVPLQPRGSKRPFFWVHGDGSNHLLPAYLGEDQPLYGFMHQSQDGTPARYRTVEEIAAHYLEELCTVQAHGPYFLGGYSFGGLLAFEMARQIRISGGKVGLLILLDPTTPMLADLLAVKGSPQIIAEKKPSIVNPGNPANINSVCGIWSHGVYMADRGSKKLARLLRTGKIVKSVRRGVYKAFDSCGQTIPLSFRSAYIMDVYTSARLAYSPSEYAGPVVFFNTESNLKQHAVWSRLIHGNYAVHVLSGSHGDLVEARQADEWAGKLHALLVDRQSAASRMAPAT